MHTLMKNTKTRGEAYFPICKVCVNDGPQLVWSRGKVTNNLQMRGVREQRMLAKHCDDMYAHRKIVFDNFKY